MRRVECADCWITGRIEHLEARAAGRGVILVTAHLGNWELGGILLARRFPMSVVTLEADDWSTDRRDAYRRRVGAPMLSGRAALPLSN